MASDEGMPTAEAVAELLTTRLGTPVTATKRGAVVLPHPRGVVATYEARHDPLGAICAFDFHLAVRLGAALSQGPVLFAEESDDESQVPESLLENLHDVCNGMTGLLGTSSLGKVSLTDVYPTPASIPSKVKPNLSRPAHRLDLVVDVEGYGRGTMSFLYGVVENASRLDESSEDEPELEDALLSIDMDF